jgi:hypothetical protein
LTNTHRSIMGVGVAGSDITTRVELTCGADARCGTEDAIGRCPEHCTGGFSLRSESAAVLAAGPESLPPAAPSASCRLTITLGPPEDKDAEDRRSLADTGRFVGSFSS